jgi:hypothetical protein
LVQKSEIISYIWISREAENIQSIANVYKSASSDIERLGSNKHILGRNDDDILKIHKIFTVRSGIVCGASVETPSINPK